VDNAGKNAMFDCWFDPSKSKETDLTKRWGPLYPRPYDMDSQMGLKNDGQESVLASAEINPLLSPAMGDEERIEEDKNHLRYGQYNVIKSRLWTLFHLAYEDKIREAYKQLRTSGIYTVENIVNTINALTEDVIGERFYNRDASAKYLSQITEDNKYVNDRIWCLQGNRSNKYKHFLTRRLDFLDTYLRFSSGNTAGEATINNNTPITLRSAAAVGIGSVNVKTSISTYNPAYITINVDQKNRQILYVDENSSHAGVPGTQFTVPVEGTDKNIYFYGAGSI
jgi:hypothetical protein